MIPGLTSKLSVANYSLATTIAPTTDIVRVSSTATTTVLATITPPFGGFSGLTILINASGANLTTVTTGNILTARTIPVDVPVLLTYVHTISKYVVGATT